MEKLIHKSFLKGDRSVSKVASENSKNTQDLFTSYRDYWTNGFGEVGEYPEMAELFLEWFQKEIARGVKVFKNGYLQKTLEMIDDLGDFIIKRWWFNNKKFKTPGDEYVMKMITILFPEMSFHEQSHSCAIITTRFVGEDQLKVEIEHDPTDCYEGNGEHSFLYYDEQDEIDYV